MDYFTEAEIEFGKNGYMKYENKDIIVYYKPYKIKDIEHKDITFCKKTGKIILYEGTNYGPDAFRMDEKLINAIQLQIKELNKKRGKL